MELGGVSSRGTIRIRNSFSYLRNDKKRPWIYLQEEIKAIKLIYRRPRNEEL